MPHIFLYWRARNDQERGHMTIYLISLSLAGLLAIVISEAWS